MTACGLAEVSAEGRAPVMTGGADSVGATFWRLTWTELRARAVAAGLLTDADIDAFLAVLDDPSFTWMEFLYVAA